MGRRANILLPSEATNDGVRLLRELLLRMTAGQIAKLVACDESAIRRYAREERDPHPNMRERFDSKLAIPLLAWSRPPAPDPYAAEAPATTKRGPPSTRPR